MDFSPEVLESVSLAAVREYLPAAVSLVAITTSDGGYYGDYAVKDANGAEIGLVILDIQGKISSERIYSIGFEKAKEMAVSLIAERGINPELLLLVEADVHHPSEHVTEIQLGYRPHIGDVPVYNQDGCSIWLNPMDGSTMILNLRGSFVLPDITPTETRISKEEAISLAAEEFSKTMEERYPIKLPQESLSSVSYRLAEPVAFVYVIYNQTADSITPVWRIPLARYITTVDDDGNAYSGNSDGGIMYEVNATTGEVLETASW